MTEREALKLALEALETGLCYVENEDFDNKQKFRGYEHLMPTDAAESIQEIKTAIAAVKEALAQPEQKPVAWFTATPIEGNGNRVLYEQVSKQYNGTPDTIPLYTTPPQRTWVGLTAKETSDFVDQYWANDAVSMKELIGFVEAKLKEKNT